MRLFKLSKINLQCKFCLSEGRILILMLSHRNKMRDVLFFMYRRPTLYPLEIAVDFLKSP
jgi:hypothetical protein